MSEPGKFSECGEIMELFSPMLDGELAGADSARLGEHLLVCDSCRQEFELWQRISETLREEKTAEEPAPDFCAGVMNRINREAGLGRGLLSRWRMPAVAAAAAAMLFAGSWGITVALKPDNQEIIAVEPGQQTGEGTTNSRPNSAGPGNAVQPENPGEAATPGGTTEKPDDGQPKNDGSGVKPPASTTMTARPERQYALLSSSQGDILSTILKLSVTNTGDAKNSALAMAGNAGGSAQVLDTQKKGAGEVMIMRITVNRDSGRSLVSRLSGLGGVIDRVDERKSISDEYNRAVNRLGEIQARTASGVTADEEKQLKAEASTLERQIQSWQKESGTYVIILWLENS